MDLGSFFRRLALVSFALCGLAVIEMDAAKASPVLDQQDGSSPGFYPIDSTSQLIGQSFKVGIAGQLDSIDVYFTNSTGNGNVTLDIYSVNSQGLPSSLLADSSNSVSALGLTANSFYAFNLAPSDLTVSAGEQLAFLLVPSSATTFSIGATSPATYAGGVFFQNVPRGYKADTGSLLFQTYVDPSLTVTPVPQSLSLMAGGLGLIGVLALYRQRRSNLSHG